MRIFDEYMCEIDITENDDIKDIINKDGFYVIVEAEDLKDKWTRFICNDLKINIGINVWDINEDRFYNEDEVYWIVTRIDSFRERINLGSENVKSLKEIQTAAKDEVRVNVAMNIRSLRKKLAITGEQIVNDLGCSQEKFWRWQTGRSMPKLFDMIDLADMFGISMDELVGRRDKFRLKFDTVGMTICDAIEYVREYHNIPKKLLHTELGICTTYDVTDPTIYTLITLADVFNTTIDCLIGRKSPNDECSNI